MKTYAYKPLISRIISPVKTKGNIVQFMRIRLNDDVRQNLDFDGFLRYVKTSKNEEVKQLPREMRRKCTPKVVAEEEKDSTPDQFAAELGINEDIVFEGHGISKLFRGRTMEGKGPKELAKLVMDVVGHYGVLEDWNGRVVLLGCRTGPMVEELSKTLKEQLKRSINVVGTKQTIRRHSTDTGIPYVYYEGGKHMKPINFTDPWDVVMSGVSVPGMVGVPDDMGIDTTPIPISGSMPEVVGEEDGFIMIG